MTSNNNYRGAMARKISQYRRQRGAVSPRQFSQIYLASNCSKPFSEMHDKLFIDLQQLIEKRGARLAIAAPRGHAKSTIVSLAFILWCLLYEKEKLILLISATREQAAMLLSHIKEQLTLNELLQTDFPELCRSDGGPGSGRQPKPWRDNRILLANGTMVCAYGEGQSLRGARNDKERPGLIIADDMEDQEQVISEDQRKKLRRWVDRTLLHAGHTGTNVIVIGTVLHHDSLLANLVNPNTSRGWTYERYKAVIEFSNRADLWDKWSAIFIGNEEYKGEFGPEAAKAFFNDTRDEMMDGVQVLWPQWESYYDLMVMRLREGRGAFQAEKQNEPIDPEQCIFGEATFHYWDDEYPDEQALISAFPKGYFYCACDPSLGNRTGKGDYSAIVILYKVKSPEVYYVLAADLARRSPDETIERIIHYCRMYNFKSIGVESNHFQQLMVENLERRAKEEGIGLNVKRIESRTNKQSRIANLEPEVAQGRIKFRKRDELLMEQLRAFPFASHDDGPDALQMAVELAHKTDYFFAIDTY